MDDARKRILDRRARFVAAAMVAAGFVSVEREGEGQTRIAPTSPSSSASDIGPSICLSDDIIEPVDAGPDASPSNEPRVCLSIVREPAGCGCDVPGRRS